MATQKPTKAAAGNKQVRARRPTPRGEPTAPTYEVLERSYIENRLIEPGQVVQYWGVPGKHLKPLNAAAKANKLAARDARAENKGDAEATAAALRELDNDLQNIVAPDEDEFDADGELTEAERKELEGQAQVTYDQTKAAQDANQNAADKAK